MPLWKLVPGTHATDPRWQDRPIFAEVIVRAATSGLARRHAAVFELGLGPDRHGHAVGNGSEPLGSALEDEKLYHMLTLDEAAAPRPPGDDGIADGVLHAVRAAPAGQGPTRY